MHKQLQTNFPAIFNKFSHKYIYTLYCLRVEMYHPRQVKKIQKYYSYVFEEFSLTWMLLSLDIKNLESHEQEQIKNHPPFSFTQFSLLLFQLFIEILTLTRVWNSVVLLLKLSSIQNFNVVPINREMFSPLSKCTQM